MLRSLLLRRERRMYAVLLRGQWRRVCRCNRRRSAAGHDIQVADADQREFAGDVHAAHASALVDLQEEFLAVEQLRHVDFHHFAVREHDRALQ